MKTSMINSGAIIIAIFRFFNFTGIIFLFQKLHKLQVKNWSPSNDEFLDIFARRSFQHLWYVCEVAWRKLAKESIVKKIREDCRGDLKKGLLTMSKLDRVIFRVLNCHAKTF